MGDPGQATHFSHPQTSESLSFLPTMLFRLPVPQKSFCCEMLNLKGCQRFPPTCHVPLSALAGCGSSVLCLYPYPLWTANNLQHVSCICVYHRGNSGGLPRAYPTHPPLPPSPTTARQAGTVSEQAGGQVLSHCQVIKVGKWQGAAAHCWASERNV